MKIGIKTQKVLFGIMWFGAFVWIILMFVGDVINHQTSLPIITQNGVITVSSNTAFESDSDGVYCLENVNTAAKLCSEPAPRVNNPEAAHLTGVLTPGAWELTPKSTAVFLHSQKDVTYNQRNIVGMILGSILMTIIFIPVGIIMIKNIK
jgi:hypothetical protein